MFDKQRVRVGIFAILAAILVYFIVSGRDPIDGDAVQDVVSSDAASSEVAPSDVSSPPDSSNTSDEAETSEVTDPVTEETAVADAEEKDVQETTETFDEPATEAEAAEPVLDVVRVEKDGSGLVAGRTTPGAQVDIVVDGTSVGSAEAGSDGSFVALIETEPSGTPQEIVARTLTSEEKPQIQSAPVFVITGESEEAPIIIAPSEDSVRLLQPPTKDFKGVTLDTISYDPDGKVQFAGRTGPESLVRMYLNGSLIAEATVSDDGSWQAAGASEIVAGVYELRVDQVALDGTVLSRISTPFLREALEGVELAEGSLTVQKGDSLWRIAERRYGSGVRYTVIVGANAESIRNPDLIYPGQIFTLPN